MEYIKQDIQDTIYNYLVNIPIPNNNLLNTNDDTIKYIKEFLQPHHSYTEPLTTLIVQFSSPTNQHHITPYLR